MANYWSAADHATLVTLPRNPAYLSQLEPELVSYNLALHFISNMTACNQHSIDISSVIQRWITAGQQQLSTILWQEQQRRHFRPAHYPPPQFGQPEQHFAILDVQSSYASWFILRVFLQASLDYSFEEFEQGSAGRVSKWFHLDSVPAGTRRIEVTFTHALSPAQSTIINSCLREMSKNFDFSIKTLKRCTISRATAVTEPYFETKDLLKDLGFVKRRWSVAEVLVKQHHIDNGKCEQLLEERGHL